MREKKLWLIITFHTTTAAMAMESLCKGIAGAAYTRTPGDNRRLRNELAGAGGKQKRAYRSCRAGGDSYGRRI